MQNPISGSGQFIALMGLDERTWIGGIDFPEEQKSRRGVFFTPNAVAPVDHLITHKRLPLADSLWQHRAPAVSEARTFWLELDPPKFLSQREKSLISNNSTTDLQLRALLAWIRGAELPGPTAMVHSGNKSVHVFWRMQEDAYLSVKSWALTQAALNLSFSSYYDGTFVPRVMEPDPVNLKIGALARMGDAPRQNEMWQIVKIRGKRLDSLGFERMMGLPYENFIPDSEEHTPAVTQKVLDYMEACSGGSDVGAAEANDEAPVEGKKVDPFDGIL